LLQKRAEIKETNVFKKVGSIILVVVST
jgi:hypothetical protein